MFRFGQTGSFVIIILWMSELEKNCGRQQLFIRRIENKGEETEKEYTKAIGSINKYTSERERIWIT